MFPVSIGSFTGKELVHKENVGRGKFPSSAVKWGKVAARPGGEGNIAMECSQTLFVGSDDGRIRSFVLTSERKVTTTSEVDLGSSVGALLKAPYWLCYQIDLANVKYFVTSIVLLQLIIDTMFGRGQWFTSCRMCRRWISVCAT